LHRYKRFTPRSSILDQNMPIRLLVTSFSVLITVVSLGACASAPQGATPPVAAPATVLAAVPTEVKVIDRKVGEGAAVENNNPIAVHYTGYLWDATAPDNKGAKFESSIEKGVPLGFIVGAGRVIAGWDAGVIGMQVGGQRTVIIPAEKAYGAKGSPQVPPNAALVFDIELMTIIGKTQNANATASPFVPAPKK
jgi:FKBP-type peptidyl-prolyl cis-trans isomerase FkpA